jgi:hypothetical protein
MGWRRWLPLGLLLFLPGCWVAMPPPAQLSYEPRGLPLGASAALVAFVWAGSEAKDPNPSGLVYHPINDLETVKRAFEDGFHKLRPTADIQWADEIIREACFGRSTESGPNSSSHFLAPDLSAAKCQALTKKMGVRYLISIGGEHEISTSTMADGKCLGKRHEHTFILDASAFDTTLGESMCASSNRSQDVSNEFVCLFFPGARLLDETYYWKDLALRTGYAIGGCFVKPDERK